MRLKQKVEKINTREEMEALVREVAMMELDRRSLTVGMEKEQLEIQRRYETKISELNEEIARFLPIAREWCEANPVEFGKRKSAEFLAGVVGWRTGTPKLKLLARWTWKKVLEALAREPLWSAYIRTVKEVDKEAIIRDRDQHVPAELSAVGVRVDQDETFFIEPKLEAFPDRLKEAA